MSNKYEGEMCPICHTYLFEDDDIVVCPVCGAPHHRSCYNSLGHCGLESLHGTAEQYDKIKHKAAEEAGEKEYCPHCGAELKADMLFCPHCGAARNPSRGGAERPPEAPFDSPLMGTIDPLGGVPPETDIGEGVTAAEAADFVKSNTVRYIPRFASGAKTGWNWLAFLFPYGFFFYHKMYRHAWLAVAVYVTALVLQLPMQGEYYAMAQGLPQNATYGDLLSAMSGGSISTLARVLYIAGVLIILALRIVCSLFADYWYRLHVVEKVKQYRAIEDEDERAAMYIKKGLPNPFFLLLSVLVFTWVPNILLAIFIS